MYSSDIKSTADHVEQSEKTHTNSPARDFLIRQGEELEELEKKIPFFQSCKQHKLLLFYMLASYSTAACYGYDTIANGATSSMPSFLIYWGHFDEVLQTYYLDSNWLSLWSSMSGAGQVVGSFVAGWLAMKIGRRWAAISCSGFTIIGVALQYIATTGGVLLAGKMINGFAIGALLAIGTAHGSESAPLSLKGPLLGGISFFAVAMQCLGLGVVRALVPDTSENSFRTAFAIQWLTGGLPIILFFLSPESPNWLISKGKTEQARKSLAMLYGSDNHIDARLAYLESVLKHENQNSESASYLACFKGSDLKRTLTVSLLYFGMGLAGSAFLTNNIYFLIIAGLPAVNCFDINIGGFALALILIPLSAVFSHKIGRRPLYLWGVFGNAMFMLVVGCLGCSSGEAVTWTIAILLNLGISWQLFTLFMVSWSMAPELSSLRLRQQTQAVGYVVQAVTTLLFLYVTPYIYNVDSGNLGAKTGFVFFGLSVILIVLSFFLIPETTGLTTEDLDILYKEKVSPRHFAKRAQALVPEKEDM